MFLALAPLWRGSALCQIRPIPLPFLPRIHGLHYRHSTCKGITPNSWLLHATALLSYWLHRNSQSSPVVRSPWRMEGMDQRSSNHMIKGYFYSQWAISWAPYSVIIYSVLDFNGIWLSNAWLKRKEEPQDLTPQFCWKWFNSRPYVQDSCPCIRIFISYYSTSRCAVVYEYHTQ